MSAAPLSVYVHLPWCVRKCPYCDFNSHALRRPDLPERAYVDALIRDLEFAAARGGRRPAASVYFGGGTPSLLSAAGLGRFLAALDSELGILAGAEITLEANPGTVEARRFREYRALGINRLSLGVQSLNDAQLAALGRIHGAAEARAAARAAHDAGFDNLNIDLMYGLPRQTPAESLADLAGAAALEPAHLSWYQLTIEPNTEFHHAPPPLPAEDDIWRMHEEGLEFLAGAGYEQYEVSAHARAGFRCRHNLNYWVFGDYLGLGAGAHGKLTAPPRGEIRREARHKVPDRYMALAGTAAAIVDERRLRTEDLVLEFMLNAGRLTEGFRLALFGESTGLPAALLDLGIAAATRRGFLEADGQRLRPTALGRRFLNDLLLCFMPQEPNGHRAEGRAAAS
jgi:oxygen-independent coproporphyrinogen-3 oxidase